MKLNRKYFSEKEAKKKEMSAEELNSLANKGIVGGTATAALGGSGLVIHRKLVKVLGKDGIAKKFPNHKLNKRLAIGASVIGTGVAVGSGIAKHKAKKMKKNEEK